MAIQYHIYSNAGNGGDVDYSTPVATTAALSVTLGPLGPGSDNTFAVRAFDTVTGLEEANTDARVRLVISGDGQDLGLPPNTPHAVWLSAALGGGCRVDWAYSASSNCGTSVGFQVAVAKETTPDIPVASVTIPFSNSRPWYSVSFPGPFEAAAYIATVASYNAAGSAVAADVGRANLGPLTPYAMGVVTVQTS